MSGHESDRSQSTVQDQPSRSVDVDPTAEVVHDAIAENGRGSVGRHQLRREESSLGRLRERFGRAAEQRFSAYFRTEGERFDELRNVIDQARFETTADEYLARTTLTVLIVALLSGVLGAGVGIAAFGPVGAGVGGVIGVGAGAGVTAFAGYWYPHLRANQRRQQIDRQLPDAVMAMYSLSQGGMELPEIVKWVGESDEIGDEVSVEFQMIVNEMETFGADLQTAIRETRDATPSADLRELLDDMDSSLRSEQDILPFLAERTERFNRRMEEQTDDYLESINNLAETFIGVVVVGGTVVVGLLTIIDVNTVGGNIPAAIGAIYYVVLPIVGVAAIATARYRSPFTPLRRGNTFDLPDPNVTSDGVEETLEAAEDELTPLETRGLEQLRDGLQAEERQSIRGWIYGRFERHPESTLFASVPIVGAYLAAVTLTGVVNPRPAGFQSDPVITTVATIVVPVATLVSPITVFKRRRQQFHEEIESQLPGVLDRLARITESGETLGGAIETVARKDGNRLEEELEGVRREIQFSTSLGVALKRMSNRVQNSRITRAVRILVESNTASGYVDEVIQNIYATVQRVAEGRRRRRSEMAPHVRGLILGFSVYLLISAFMLAFLLPNVEMIATVDAQAEAAGVGAGTTTADLSANTYRVLLFHGAIVQSVVYGGLAGELLHGDAFRGGGLTLAGLVASVVVFGVI